MSDVIGRGIIEVSADSSKMEAAISDARKSIASLGEASKNASASSARSIDRYVQSLQTQSKMIGKSTREQELYKLALRGASDEQLKTANSALQISENYQKGVKSTENLKSGLIAAAAAAVTVGVGIATLVKSSINAADEMGKLSQKTGVSVESLSALAYAGELSGISIEDLGSGLKKLSVSMSDAAVNAKGTAGQAFKALGIDVKNAAGGLRSSDEIFADVADKFAGVQDGAEKTAMAVAIFGKAGADLVPMLNLGRGGLGDIKTEAEKLGLIMTGDLAKSSEQFNDNLSKIKLSSSALGMSLANDLLPTITALSNEYLAAKRAGLSFSDSLVEIGLRSPGKSSRENIKNIDAEIAALEKWLVKNENATASMVKHNKEAISRKKNAREYFLEMERTAALEGAGADVNYRKEGSGVTTPEPPKPSGFGLGDIESMATRLEKLKRLTDEELSLYANAEKVIEARHVARNLEDSDYYAAKLAFINLNSNAQEAALKKEISLLQQENLSGNDKVENAKKIADAQGKLNKLRADSTANVVILSIQEEAANLKVQQSYMDAELAAKRYIATIQQQAAREINGIGKGTEHRANNSAKKEIEDRQAAQRQKLEDELRLGKITQEQFKTYSATVESTYKREVQIYETTRLAIKDKQSDWLNGANEASQNFLSNAENVAGNSAAMFSGAFDGMLNGVSSSISRAIVYGEDLQTSLENVALNIADAFIASFIKIQIQKLFIDKTTAAAYAATLGLQSEAMVAMAGLNAFASTAAIPIVGPAAAPAAAAAAIAAAQGFASIASAAATASIASARNGYDIPAGVNPITQLHEKEMVLPAPQAQVIRDLARGGDTGGGRNVVIHSSPVISIDSRTDQAEIARLVRTAVQQGNAQLVDKLQRSGQIA